MSTKNNKITDKEFQEQLKAGGIIPQHIAIIMDGNGRWAKSKKMPRIAGHREGVNSVRDIVEVCGDLGVKYLTLYAFSTENWKRPKDEVSMLMRLLLNAIKNERDRLHKNNVRLRCIGDIASLPKDIQDELLNAMTITQRNTGLTLILALSYSGRWDITTAVKSIARDIEEKKLQASQISEEFISQYLSTREYPDPDLIIRTSGEYRISNFLLWQLAYSEFVIAKENWPNYRRKNLYQAIMEYQTRERRFGLTSEQLSTKYKKEASKFVKGLIKRVFNSK